MINFTTDELTWLDDNKDLIDSKNYYDIFFKLATDFGVKPSKVWDKFTARRLAFLIALLIGGEKCFRFQFESRGSSRSHWRADMGAQILRFYLICTIDGKNYRLNYLKGTLNPDKLTWDKLNNPTEKLLKHMIGDGSYMDLSKVHINIKEQWEAGNRD